MPYTITASFKRALFFFVIFFLTVVKGYSQQFYIAASKNGSKIPLQRVTLTPNGPVSVRVGGCGANDFFSIAILGNKLYYSSGSSMFVGDITGGNSPTITNCVFLGAANFGNALTIDKKGILYYAAANRLYSFNPGTKRAIFLGTMPYNAAGDLAFYNNELYMVSGRGIIKVNLANAALSTLYIPIPNEVIYSLTAASINGVTKMYAISDYPVHRIYELNMQSRRIKAVVGALPYDTLDAASDGEAGDVKYIQIDHISIKQECDIFNKGHAEIVTKPHTSQYTYTLNTGQTNKTGIFSNLSPGNYVVTITSDGTEPPNPVNLTVPDYTIGNPIISVTKDNPVCSKKGSIKLDAGAENSTHSIRFNNQIYSFDHVFSDLSAGDYHFTILNQNGCITDEKNYTLTLGNCPPIAITDVAIQPECDIFNRGNVKISTATHTANYTYILNGTTNVTGVFNNLLPGNYTLTIVSDGVEQPVNQAVVVPNYSKNGPAITFIDTKPRCEVKGSIKLSAGTANALYKIRYNGQVFDFDHTFTGLDAGNYHFTILNQNGCIVDEKDYTLQQDNCPPIAITDVAIQPECDIFNRGNVKISTATHTANYTYILNGTTNVTGVFNNLLPGNYTLTIVSDGVEQPVNQAVVVPDYSKNGRAITFIDTKPLCDAKGSIKLSAGTANALYKIRYNGQVFDFDHTFTGLDAGNYHFTILKANGCIADEKDHTLQQDNCPPIVINEVQVQAECNAYGQASVKVITQVHPDTYTYILNNESNTTGVFDFLTPGTYTLVVNSSGGDHKEREVIVPDFTLNKPAITYKVKSAVCTLLGEIKFTINGDARGAVKVKNGINIYNIDETIKGLTPGPNHFTILNQQDCILDELDVNVLQDKCEPVVFPNTFTPNGDGINDFFGANQESNPLSFKLVIYNRWGSQVFQSQSIFNRWDGTSKGTSAPFGVYYWIATYQMPDGKSNHQKGYVTLIR
ncbi:gliding motility-associated C-terminal domain-containing protein [Mucilaginibacter pocheonensis]|uniref:Gliding motility-associated-like protein n=1 Tax=Mucilaginibacter pocheonensis TaxID=398050 RepID=A0ABU1T529_9SPHI|nr:gliding motility-associated C-terminal domain-containing protein [Mucilaginibacter pocheonensis]MDR6940488.1 gliding motility-associated-like protein [Mucilaginibacter pocheonensis]